MTAEPINAKLAVDVKHLSCLLLLLAGAPIPGAGQEAKHVSVPELEAAARRDSNDALAHYELGVAYAADHQRDKAKEAFLTAVRIDPQLAPAYVALGRLGSYELWGGILVAGKGRDSVTLMLRRAFQLDPLEEVSNTSGYYVPMVWKMTIDHALKMYHQDKYKQSRDEFDALIAKTEKPNDPEAIPGVALWYHALASVRLGAPDMAIADVSQLMDRVTRIGSDSTKRENQITQEYRRALTGHYGYVLAYLHQLAGHSEEAIRRYQEASEGDLSLYGPHLQMARIYEGTGSWVQAIVERRRAIDASPDDPSLVFDLGVTLVKAGEFAEADTVLGQAIAANPRETRSHYALGIAKERLGKVAEARQEYATFLAEAPRRFDQQLIDASRRLAALP
ncbi:MAG TPA: tetratricopeptide repeat protein [Gemmatimonadales bacterium]|nr:tetratricopeptide repeat protein [Gemmatimonadales bacterium]